MRQPHYGRLGTSCHDCPVTRITTSRILYLDRVGGLRAGCFCLCKAYAGRHSHTLHIDSCCYNSAGVDALLHPWIKTLGVSYAQVHVAIRVTAIDRYPEHGAYYKVLMILFVIVLYHTATTSRGRYVNIRDSVPSVRQ